MGEKELRELAERVLAHPMPFGEVPKVQLLEGQLPGEPELRIAPAGARVIGTVIREPGHETDRDYEIVLDAPGGEDQIVSFYTKELGRLGWTNQGDPIRSRSGGGFMPFPPGMGNIFRREGGGIAIMLAVRPLDERMSEVRIRTQWFPPEMDFHGPPYEQDLIPGLRPPAGVRLEARGGGGGGGEWTSSARAQTSMSVADLEAHFAKQLEAGGWQRISGSASGPLAWSGWKIDEKDDWFGYLFVVEAPVPDQRSLWVRAERMHHGGWRAYGFSSMRPLRRH
jgi:hypothetical protein